MSLPTLDEVLGPKPEHYTAALFAPVMEELLEMIEVLERHGGAYARAYLEFVREGAKGYGPKSPRGLNPHVSKAIREVVLDHAQHARFTRMRS